MASALRVLLTRLAAVAAVTGLVSAHAGASATQDADAPVPAWREARQLILVVTPDWDATGGRMQTFERDGDNWRATAASAC